MHFKDRTEAGSLLAQALKKHANKKVMVYALPRGGVSLAIAIARFLHAPLDLIIVRKIGHPALPEYAIAATAESGRIITSTQEAALTHTKWFIQEAEKQRQEAKRRREQYLTNQAETSVAGKIAILVDDGIATGLTMRMAILELKHRQPKKIVVAVPVVPQTTAELIETEADEIIALDMPKEADYLGAVGAYYNNFLPVEDAEVIALMQSYKEEYASSKKGS